MTEVANINKDTTVSLEAPRYTALVTLPFLDVEILDREIQIAGRNIRLAMHTDSVLTLLRTLRRFPDVDQLRIEGRVLNDKQKETLKESPTYNFYLLGRLHRSGFLLPSSLSFTPEIIAELLQLPFSPSSSEKDVGYKTGYFSAWDLVGRWINEGRPNDLLPIIGGVNEFHIGSDTLTPQRLSVMATSLNQAFVEQEQSMQLSRAIISIPPSFTLYPIQKLFPSIDKNFNKITKFIDRDLDNKKIINEHYIPLINKKNKA